MNLTLQKLLAKADALAARQDYTAAAAAYQQALSQQPGNARVLCAMGMALYQAGDLTAAGNAFQEALTHKRNAPQAHYGLGLVLQQAGKLSEANRAITKAVKIKPSNALYHLMLAGVLQQMGEGKQAHKHLTRATRLDPGNPQAFCLLATSFEQMHKLDDAFQAVQQALHITPGHPHARLIQARLERRSNRPAAARNQLEQLIKSQPGEQVTYRAAFELGRVLDKLGDYKAAFDAFAHANRLQLNMPEALNCDPESYYRIIEEYAELTAGQFTRWSDATDIDDDLQPVFLVGFPRSGTTMTEQVLASHPNLSTADEKPLLAKSMEYMHRFPAQGRLSRQLDALTGIQIREMRAIYRRATRDMAKPKGGIVIDKLPLNIMALGFINRVFPDARIIVALRDPRDVCLSCFMQEFEPNAGMINFNTLEGTARFYNAVMTLWVNQRDILTLKQLEIRYEDTTSDLEKQARRILEFLEQPWNRSVLDFHKQHHYRAVTTPSYEAISEPVNQRAVGRWEKYTNSLEPIMDTLAPLVKTLGYE